MGTDHKTKSEHVEMAGSSSPHECEASAADSVPQVLVSNGDNPANQPVDVVPDEHHVVDVPADHLHNPSHDALVDVEHASVPTGSSLRVQPQPAIVTQPSAAMQHFASEVISQMNHHMESKRDAKSSPHGIPMTLNLTLPSDAFESGPQQDAYEQGFVVIVKPVRFMKSS